MFLWIAFLSLSSLLLLFAKTLNSNPEQKSSNSCVGSWTSKSLSGVWEKNSFWAFKREKMEKMEQWKR